MFDTVSVFGAGTMGHGIAQVCAQAGSRVWLHDVDQSRVDAGLAHIKKSLDKGVEKGKVTAEAREATLGRIRGTTDAVIAASEGELLVEAIPENLELKQDLFRKLDQHAEEGTVFATNTSSLSVAKIAEAVSDPSRVIGTHFFNPVPIMTLLEIVFHTTTANEVIDAIREYGKLLGKECIVVKDVPGFATSRLGVCLGMEAIRMLEAGVASAEDIDKAMVLGYRHPVGPLRLTDMVGLDVRLAIGTYLAKELGNAAFEPPALMRRMVQEGKLGQKSGEGFYRWP
jgi:3-hydroxybutyryl-CoA dehydrogenase